MTDEKNMQQELPLKLIHMDEVEATDTKWLWYPYIPYGKITIIQGDPGEGKEAAVKQAKADYESKVRTLKADISTDRKKLTELEKEYQQLVCNEQRETLSAMMFNGDLSPSDINAALNALNVMLSGSGDKTAAIQKLQALADEQENSAISNLVSEISNENG